MRSGVPRIIVAVSLAAGLVAPALTAPAHAADTTSVKKRIVVGKTYKNRDIIAYYRGDAKPTRVLLVLGQMHGDEPAGRDTALQIAKKMRPRAGTGVWVIPSMNPDGRARRTRTNARGVDLNRNWPTSGWIRGKKGSRTYGGAKRGSERETRAMMRFLTTYKPDYIASIHQPLKGIGRSDKDVAYEKRLAKYLGLKRKYFGVAQGKGVSPTLTGWYHRYLGKHGTAITVEYGSKPSKKYRTSTAPRGLLKAARVDR